MKESTKRSLVRWLHIIIGIPIIGYIYSPFDLVHYYAPITRYVSCPHSSSPASGFGRSTLSVVGFHSGPQCSNSRALLSAAPLKICELANQTSPTRKGAKNEQSDYSRSRLKIHRRTHRRPRRLARQNLRPCPRTHPRCRSRN